MVKGYKQTEVGDIPSDWSILSIGEEFSFKNGLNKEKHFFGYGTPIVNYMDVHGLTGIKNIDIKGRVFLNVQEIKNYQVLKGDVLFTRTSETVEEIGTTAVIIEDLKDTVFSGFVLRGRPKNKLLDIEFCRYCFSSVIVRKQILTTASYTTRALTNGRLLSEVQIPLPPTKAEQTAIATALNDADALIQKLEQLISKKRNIKSGAMQELLRPKEGWEEKKLGEVANFFSGGTPSTSISSYYGGDIPWITSSDLNKEKIFEVEGKITEEGLRNSSAKRVKKGTLLLALYGATAGVTAMTFIDAAINQAVLAIEPHSDNSDFLFYKFSYLKSWIVNTFTQGGQANLSANIIKALELKFPNLEEQTRIAQILSDMDNEIQELEKQLEKYKMLKQGMMQSLLTGKIRLVH